MAGSFRRPKTKAELQEREAAGLWQAQVLAKSIGERREKITIDVIQKIHRVFFEHVNPDMAGRFRVTGQDVEKLRCLTPPPGTAVRNRMYEFWRELDTKIAALPSKPAKASGKKEAKKSLAHWNDQVLDLAAWTQYKMAAIHPFAEGNGRMARLMTNLILYRFGLQPTDIKYEGDNKERYLKALCAIDRRNDFRFLKQLIVQGIYRSYQKLLAAQKRAKSAVGNK
jgi:fido (protein-threonine AMPylation protein)